jgi:hypothetical protein
MMQKTRMIGIRAALVLLLAVLLPLAGGAGSSKFYPDDPIWHDPEPQDASGVAPMTPSLYFDFLESTFLRAGDRTNRRAMNVNTLDEVPDSSWFTNRIGHRPVSLEDMARGPDTGTAPRGPWTVTGGKRSGISPGLTMRDAAGDLYFVKFDPPGHAELGSGAEIIATKIFHALGYNVPEIYVPRIRREELHLSPEAMTQDPGGVERPMTPADIDLVLSKAAPYPDGTYRIIAGKGIPNVIGPFRYYGTRPDDPNDIFPHEHRRELRAIRVFAAWLAHNDLKSDNTLDALEDVGGRQIVRHYLRDFNSTLGSSSIYAKRRREGNEHIWEAGPTFRRILTLGLYPDPWLLVKFPDIPSVGHFEATFFRPERWKPTYPQPALDNARPDDTFWAARRVMAFSDEQIRAAVGTAAYTDPRAEDYLVEMLGQRRDKIGRVWLTDVNPAVDFELNGSGVLSFRNAAVDLDVATAPAEYRIRWFAFDNESGSAKTVGDEMRVGGTQATAPSDLLARKGFILAEVAARHPQYPSWAKPVHVYFRHAGNGWQTVGFERLPDGVPGTTASRAAAQ